jgi:hypothetical protein
LLRNQCVIHDYFLHNLFENIALKFDDDSFIAEIYI